MTSTWRFTASAKRAGIGFGLAGQHGERRLEEMREIGNMGAGAAHHFGGMFDQAVEFGGERRDLGGEISFQPARRAAADARQRLAHARAAATDRRAPGGRSPAIKPSHKSDERPDQRAVEVRDLGVDARKDRPPP